MFPLTLARRTLTTALRGREAPPFARSACIGVERRVETGAKGQVEAPANRTMPERYTRRQLRQRGGSFDLVDHNKVRRPVQSSRTDKQLEKPFGSPFRLGYMVRREG